MSARLVFSHANGFGAGTYRVLFEHWRAAGYRVEAVERFGHDPAYPVTSNWRGLRDQLLDFVAAGGPQPVWLVGHSLGGLLSLLAACRRPEWVHGVVLLDSPVITGWRAHTVHMFKRSGLIRRVSPGKISQRRRHEWPDRQAVLAHFASKPMFARWDPRVLQDYVDTGFDEADGQIRLGFRREVETRIYNTLPHHLGPLLRRHPPRSPVAFIAGTQSSEIRQAGLGASRQLAAERFVWLEGTHLYPMERPDDTARLVLSQLASMGGLPLPAA
ncbi:alpha/beta fold hydrolase [Ideonella livida]|uniref:Alpha/beta hydrolase n=1 Tax=Ideonella livida TaxID=2707176 RepID=A0A7C9TI17_9BURK|nr:alpha/beta hydrolase [Ideonella livida]NDY90818.1 alpha/beta hydrolase [Ideonella livida]